MMGNSGSQCCFATVPANGGGQHVTATHDILGLGQRDLHVFHLINHFAIGLDDAVSHAHCQAARLDRFGEINLINQKTTGQA